LKYSNCKYSLRDGKSTSYAKALRHITTFFDSFPQSSLLGIHCLEDFFPSNNEQAMQLLECELSKNLFDAKTQLANKTIQDALHMTRGMMGVWRSFRECIQNNRTI